MASFAEVQQALTDMQASIDAMQAKIAQAIASLKQQITDGATPEQLTKILENLQAEKADVDSTPAE